MRLTGAPENASLNKMCNRKNWSFRKPLIGMNTSKFKKKIRVENNRWLKKKKSSCKKIDRKPLSFKCSCFIGKHRSHVNRIWSSSWQCQCQVTFPRMLWHKSTKFCEPGHLLVFGLQFPKGGKKKKKTASLEEGR